MKADMTRIPTDERFTVRIASGNVTVEELVVLGFLSPAPARHRRI